MGGRKSGGIAAREHDWRMKRLCVERYGR